MTEKPTLDGDQPGITLSEESDGTRIVLTGAWTLRTLAADPALRRTVGNLGAATGTTWDLGGIETLDSAAAFQLWHAWGGRFPSRIVLRPKHRRLFHYWRDREIPVPPSMVFGLPGVLRYWHGLLEGFYQHLRAWLVLFGRLILDSFYLLRHPHAVPYREISTSLYRAGVSALGITALVGFLVGVSLSYLSSLQLQRFGAEIFIIDLVGLAIVRELGPMLAAILIAGRSGSAITAEIGIMRVTQELDALSALGISHSLRIVLPQVVALSLSLPLLIVWTDLIAVIGGMVSAQLTLDIGYEQFIDQLPKSVPAVNFYIGFAKGFTFGMMIALVACHFGFLIQPNTESLGIETTHAVVATITIVIVVDTVFSILFRNVGFP